MTRFESGDATIQLELKDSAGSAAIGAVGNAFPYSYQWWGGDERVRVSAAGSFGIGLTDPKSLRSCPNKVLLHATEGKI